MDSCTACRSALRAAYWVLTGLNRVVLNALCGDTASGLYAVRIAFPLLVGDEYSAAAAAVQLFLLRHRLLLPIYLYRHLRG